MPAKDHRLEKWGVAIEAALAFIYIVIRKLYWD